MILLLSPYEKYCRMHVERRLKYLYFLPELRFSQIQGLGWRNRNDKIDFCFICQFNLPNFETVKFVMLIADYNEMSQFRGRCISIFRSTPLSN